MLFFGVESVLGCVGDSPFVCLLWDSCAGLGLGERSICDRRDFSTKFPSSHTNGFLFLRLFVGDESSHMP